MSLSLHHRLQLIKDASYAELNEKHLKVVFETYYEIFGKVCSGCPSKIAGYIKQLKNYDIMSKKNKQSKFVLKEGGLIVFRGQSKAYSNANLTDEVAVRFLKGNENRKALFSKLPANIDELLSADSNDDNAESVKFGDVELSVDKSVELLAGVGVKTKAKTVEGVQKKVDALTDEQKSKFDELLSAQLTEAAKNSANEEIDENSQGKSTDEEE